MANSSHANFISIKGPELLNKFVGESERGVRQVFHRARQSSPCIIFFDELDALCPKRDDDSAGRGSQRLVNQLLTEMDGFDVDPDKQVFVIAATNRPDIIDPAMLRPGRLDKLVYVDIPSASARKEILVAHTRKLQLAADVDLDALASDARCEGFTGADLAALVREGGTHALRRIMQETRQDAHALAIAAPAVCHSDFAQSFAKVFASVSKKDLHRYRNMKKKLQGSRAVMQEDKAAASNTAPAPPAASNNTAAATARPEGSGGAGASGGSKEDAQMPPRHS